MYTFPGDLVPQVDDVEAINGLDKTVENYRQNVTRSRKLWEVNQVMERVCGNDREKWRQRHERGDTAAVYRHPLRGVWSHLGVGEKEPPPPTWGGT